MSAAITTTQRGSSTGSGRRHGDVFCEVWDADYGARVRYAPLGSSAEHSLPNLYACDALLVGEDLGSEVGQPSARAPQQVDPHRPEHNESGGEGHVGPPAIAK